MSPLPDRIFILEETASKIDVFACEGGRVAIHCGALIDSHSAIQLKHALMAVLSGEFDRAMSESALRFDLARDAAQVRNSASASPQISPNLEML